MSVFPLTNFILAVTIFVYLKLASEMVRFKLIKIVRPYEPERSEGKSLVLYELMTRHVTKDKHD